jgi:hypothetical protein
MPRKCSCCGVAGHIVSACNNDVANVLMAQLFQEVSAGAAMEKVNAMTAGIVSFVLSRGFGVPISGKRPKLIELVLARYPASAVLEYRELANRRQAAVEIKADQRRIALLARRIARERLINDARSRNAIIREENESYDALYDGLQQRYDALLIVIGNRNRNQSAYVNTLTLLPLNQSINPRLTAQVMMEFVNKFLTTIYRLETERASSFPDLTRQHEINTRINEKLNSIHWVESSLGMTAHSYNLQFSQSGIVHMTQLAKLLNYRRMLQADQSYFDFTFQQQQQQPEYNVQMKVLNIHVGIVVKKTEEPQECGVCFDSMSAHNTVLTGCNHAFCTDCIGGFARTRGIKSFIKCPLCRTEITEFSVSCQEKHIAVVAGLAPVPI